MPCYQVQTVSVEFKIAHRDLLDKALKTLGWAFVNNGQHYTICLSPTSRNILLDLGTGKATLNNDQQGKLNELKQAYAMEAIKLATQSVGWRVNLTTKTTGQLVRGCI